MCVFSKLYVKYRQFILAKIKKEQLQIIYKFSLNLKMDIMKF